MKRRFAGLALLMLVAAWASACMPKVQRPEVSLAGVRVGGLGLNGGMLYVRLNVVNPNSFALKANGFTYRIELREPATDSSKESWAQLADGTFDKEVKVGGKDTATVEIPVEFRYSGIGSAVRSLMNTGTFNYRVSGKVAVESPVTVDLPYKHEGTASLSGAN